MIIAVDFDGTMCVNQWPDIGAPREGVIAFQTDSGAVYDLTGKVRLDTPPAPQPPQEVIRYVYLDSDGQEIPPDCI